MPTKEWDQVKWELLTYLMCLAIYAMVIYLVFMPDWKRRALIQKMLPGLRSPRGLLTAEQEMQIREFRDRVSRWDHESATRHHSEEGN